MATLAQINDQVEGCLFLRPDAAEPVDTRRPHLPGWSGHWARMGRTAGWGLARDSGVDGALPYWWEAVGGHGGRTGCGSQHARWHLRNVPDGRSYTVPLDSGGESPATLSPTALFHGSDPDSSQTYL